MWEVIPLDSIEDSELAAPATGELMSRDAVWDQVFEGGVDVFRGDVVERAGGSEMREKVGGEARGEVPRHGMVVVGMSRSLASGD